MARYIVGSDRTGGAEECLRKVVTEMEKGTMEVLNCGVTPNTEGSFRKHGKKDDIGVFVINGICLGTILSCNQMVESGICSQVIIGIPKPLMATPFNTKESLTDESLTLALVNDGTNWPSSYKKYEKKYTVDGICNALSGISYAWGETCEELGQNILNGVSGTSGGSSGDTGDSDSDSDKKEPTPMSYMDMIKDLISVWDGDVECTIRQDKIFINKVPQPNPELWIVEGNNIVSGQAKVKDYNSDTINTLNVTYDGSGHTITITDEYLVNRFGEVNAELEAKKIVTDYSGDSSASADSSSEGNGATKEQSTYSQISGVIQKYYDKPSEGWNSLTNKLRKAETGDEIGNILKNLKKKKGQEKKSVVDVRHEIQKIRGMGY